MPIERFPSKKPLGEASSDTIYTVASLRIALENILAPRGILKKDYVRNQQTGATIFVYTVGESEEKPTVVVLVGLEEPTPGHKGGMTTPHKLIAPRWVINSVNAELDRIIPPRPFT